MRVKWANEFENVFVGKMGEMENTWKSQLKWTQKQKQKPYKKKTQNTWKSKKRERERDTCTSSNEHRQKCKLREMMVW